MFKGTCFFSPKGAIHRPSIRQLLVVFQSTGQEQTRNVLRWGASGAGSFMYITLCIWCLWRVEKEQKNLSWKDTTEDGGIRIDFAKAAAALHHHFCTNMEKNMKKTLLPCHWGLPCTPQSVPIPFAWECWRDWFLNRGQAWSSQNVSVNNSNIWGLPCGCHIL